MKINILVKAFAGILMVLGILTGALWLSAAKIYAAIYRTGEGEIEIAVSGSDRRISIRRNDLGVPHITAGKRRMRAGLHLLHKKMSRTFLSPTWIIAANVGGTTWCRGFESRRGFQ